MTLAPIAFFCYNRPEHTLRSLQSLADNTLSKKSDLIIFCDGPRNHQDTLLVEYVRYIVNSHQWCGTVRIVEQSTNLGLAKSIISGVTDIVNEYGKIIVLEDDMVVAPYFLDFMNEALEIYTADHRIGSVSGFCNPIPMKGMYFIRGAEIWGWGTWKRAWHGFRPDTKKLLQELKEKGLTRQFNINGSLNCTKMLRDHIRGKASSWGVRWYASTFLSNQLNLYPPKTLVKNIGMDGTGRHKELFLFKDPEPYQGRIVVYRIPAIESKKAVRLLTIHFYKRFLQKCIQLVFGMRWLHKIKG